jgi:hypothetical protein
MTTTRWIALFWILLSSGISFLWSSSVKKTDQWVDFRAVYYDTLCLIQHRNPYKASELEGIYRAKGWERPSNPTQAPRAETLDLYLPTTFILVAPFAILPWGPALLLWMTLTTGVFILAAFLMWNLGARYAPTFTLVVICILLANCEIIFALGQTAGIAIGLCLIAVWCFLEERFIVAGVLCMAVSLAIKPHDAGLIWLYFLLAGGRYRKRALQTLLITVVLGLAAILWVTPIAPHWMQDWNSNLSIISAHSGFDDPGPTSATGRTTGLVIDLQSSISIFRDDPRIYNPLSYLVCGSLLLAWSVRTLRSRFSQRGTWLALAAVVPLSMLVTYHRPYDAKLLLLTVPACAMLLAEGGAIGRLAFLVTSAGIVLTADLPLIILTILTGNLHISTTGISGQILTVVLMRPIPLILLAMSIFYLWIYMRRDSERALP